MTVERGFLKMGDEQYPQCLYEIASTPKQLEYLGDLSVLKRRRVAVVGARRCTPYGVAAATKIGEKLAAYGVTVVSGLAVGVDSIAQKACLDAGGTSIAVLGTGLDVDYPAANRKLKKRITEHGLLLSEYSPSTRGNKYSFPRRNRIISGLAEATIVVEAGQNSGSLITANYSNDQNRPTFAVPGRIDSVLSLGTNQLIRDGAQIFLTVEDVLQTLHIPLKAPALDDPSLGKEEAAIIGLLSERGEMNVDEISRELRLSAGQVNGIVGVMEIKGYVATALGRVFLNL